MTPKEELKRFVAAHGDDPRVVDALLEMAIRAAAGESMESIAASYGVKCDSINQAAQGGEG